MHLRSGNVVNSKVRQFGAVRAICRSASKDIYESNLKDMLYEAIVSEMNKITRISNGQLDEETINKFSRAVCDTYMRDVRFAVEYSMNEKFDHVASGISKSCPISIYWDDDENLQPGVRKILIEHIHKILDELAPLVIERAIETIEHGMQQQQND